MNLTTILAEVEADHMKFEDEYLIFRRAGENNLAPIRMIKRSLIGDVERLSADTPRTS